MKDPLTPEDKALWKLFSKEVERLKKPKSARPPTLSPLPSKIRIRTFKRTIPIPDSRRKKYELIPLEARQLKNIIIEGRLDLHGYKIEEAEMALNRFMTASQEINRRWVLIITGKGLHSADGQGTIKRAVQVWFYENTHLVGGFIESKPEHGGAGAFYVKVRRVRQDFE